MKLKYSNSGVSSVRRIFSVKWVLHRSMAHPEVADGGDGLYVWTAAANVLNKQ